MLLRHYLVEGMPKARLARKFGISRDTIHRLTRTGQLERDLGREPVRYTSCPPVATKLDAYEGAGRGQARLPDEDAGLPLAAGGRRDRLPSDQPHRGHALLPTHEPQVRDEVMAAALLDRLLHHCHIVNVRGNSYRLRQHAGFARAAAEEPGGSRGSGPTPRG